MSNSTSPNTVFATELYQRIKYDTQMTSASIAFENLKRLHPSLNNDDIFALAYMALNPAISQEERDLFLECLRLKCQQPIYL